MTNFQPIFGIIGVVAIIIGLVLTGACICHDIKGYHHPKNCPIKIAKEEWLAKGLKRS